MKTSKDQNDEDAQCAGLDLLKVSTMALGKPTTIPAKDDQRDPVSDSTFRDLLTQPHHEHTPRREGDHRHQSETPTWVWYQGGSTRSARALQEDGDTQRLHRRRSGPFRSVCTA